MSDHPPASDHSSDLPSTPSHSSHNAPDPTQTPREPRLTSSTAKLTSLKIKLRKSIRQFPDFPRAGILFEDIFPLFADPSVHEALISALELHILTQSGLADNKPDIIVGLDARGFLFGTTLALRLGAGFVPVRKRGKLPGECVEAAYEKEYGTDYFQMQKDSIKPGQKVIIVDDLIATGGSAAAAGSLVKQLGGNLLAYIFIIELDFLKGRDKLHAPAYTLLNSQGED
ncbi:MAG: adenine phosphoribosyltransferase [Cirrosporium novae-zelandiae]|nr:MAG: adenine phosphoribosyltransferase [Cirrosporium novae-zelandiae]